MDRDEQSLASAETQIAAAIAKLDALADEARAAEAKGQSSKLYQDLISLYQRNLAALENYHALLKNLMKERKRSPWIGGP